MGGVDLALLKRNAGKVSDHPLFALAGIGVDVGRRAQLIGGAEGRVELAVGEVAVERGGERARRALDRALDAVGARLVGDVADRAADRAGAAAAEQAQIESSKIKKAAYAAFFIRDGNTVETYCGGAIRACILLNAFCSIWRMRSAETLNSAASSCNVAVSPSCSQRA